MKEIIILPDLQVNYSNKDSIQCQIKYIPFDSLLSCHAFLKFCSGQRRPDSRPTDTEMIVRFNKAQHLCVVF